MNYQEVSLLALFLLEQVINDNIAFITNHVGDEKCNQEGCFALVTDYDELEGLLKSGINEERKESDNLDNILIYAKKPDNFSIADSISVIIELSYFSNIIFSPYQEYIDILKIVLTYANENEPQY